MTKDEYMNEAIFPDPKITRLILESLDGFLGLKHTGVDSGIHPTFNYKYCKFEFQIQITTLRLSLVERPNSNIYGLVILIVREKHKHFSFDDYLKFINSSELKNIENNPALDNYASIEAQLLLFKKYLETELRRIFTENDWIEVPFDRD